MVLVFMFAASWRLTVVTFVLVPCVLIISKVGYYSLPGGLPPGGLPICLRGRDCLMARLAVALWLTW
jgi:hypothetical protein